MLRILSRLVINHPRTILGVIALITAALGYHIQFLQVDFSIEQLFPEKDPDRQIYFDFRENFALDDDLFLMVYETDSVCSPKNLELVRHLTWNLEELEGVEEVYSLTNIERMSLEGGLLTLDYYFPADLPADEIAARKAELLEHPFYRNVVISSDGRLGGLLVNVDDDYNTHTARETLLDEIDSLRVGIPWVWHDAGLPIIRTRYVQYMNREQAIFLPAAMLISLLMLYALFRQGRAVFVPLTAILVTLPWLAGLLALRGVPGTILCLIPFTLLLCGGFSV